METEAEDFALVDRPLPRLSEQSRNGVIAEIAVLRTADRRPGRA